MKYIRKKIWLNHTNYVWVKVYDTVKELRRAWDTDRVTGKEHLYGSWGIKGFHEAFIRLDFSPGKKGEVHPNTGIIHLCKAFCQPEIVGHEFGHAVLHAKMVAKNKDQYPHVIKNMDEEEDILTEITHATRKFFKWYKNLPK